MAISHSTDQDFEQKVLKNATPVLVDFWAPWCSPCHAVAPILEELEKEYEGKIKFTKVNVDQNPQSPSQYGIMSIPTILIFSQGSPQKTIIGAQRKDVFKKAIDEVLS